MEDDNQDQETQEPTEEYSDTTQAFQSPSALKSDQVSGAVWIKLRQMEQLKGLPSLVLREIVQHVGDAAKEALGE